MHVELHDEFRTEHDQRVVGRLLKSIYDTCEVSSYREHTIHDVLVNKTDFIQDRTRRQIGQTTLAFAWTVWNVRNIPSV